MSTFTTAGEPAAPPTFALCGVPITAVGLDGACELLLGSRFGEGRAVHHCNAYTLSLGVRDERFRQVLAAGDLNFADGHPVVIAGRRRGYRAMSSRAYGPDVMLAVLEADSERRLRHYLYGGSPPVLAELARTIASRFVGTNIVGTESPPFRALTTDEEARMVGRIRDARPDIVWVGLGTPRQDEFVARHRDHLDATLVAVGAAFDFLAGAKPQAPAWMRRHGLEWIFRLVSEPRRLWRRYLVGNTVFATAVIREELKARRQR